MAVPRLVRLLPGDATPQGTPTPRRGRRPLRPYQRDMLRWLLDHRSAALYVEMRLGKTLPTVRRLLMAGVKRVLIVAPFSALYSWRDELRNEGETDIHICYGTGQERELGIREEHRWTLVNVEAHRNRWVAAALQDIPYDALILDESTFIKGPQSAVTRFYVDKFRHVPLRVLLSGTPAPESEAEYFEQLNFLDPTLLGYRTYWDFRAACMALPVTATSDNHGWFVTAAGRGRIAAALAQCALFLKRSDVRLGGEKVYIKRMVELSATVREAYVTCEDDYELMIDGKHFTTLWSGAKFQWLRRLTGGVFDGKIVDRVKLDELLYILEKLHPTDQIIVWADFVHELQAIQLTLTLADIDTVLVHGDVPPAERDERKRRFIDGDVRVFVGQPGCFRHGTDLSAASVMVYYSTPTGLETRQQSEDRMVDVKRSDSLLVYDIIASDTIDEDIHDGIAEKATREQMMRRIVEGVRRRRELA